jgi:hypothetical protein
MPPTPQPTTPSPLIIVVCESVPTSVSGNANVSPASSSKKTDARQVLEVHLVHDAGAGRHDAQPAHRLLPPAQELVALLVALVLELDVAAERGQLAVRVHLHRVVDDEVARAQRVHVLRAPPSARTPRAWPPDRPPPARR